MKWIHDAVADFGRRLGIDTLALDSHGLVQLQFESGDLLAVEPRRREEIDEVLVYLLRPGARTLSRSIRRGLAKSHYTEGGTLPVQVAMRGSGPEASILALVRIPERELTAQNLAMAVEHLGRWVDDIEGG